MGTHSTIVHLGIFNAEESFYRSLRCLVAVEMRRVDIEARDTACSAELDDTPLTIRVNISARTRNEVDPPIITGVMPSCFPTTKQGAFGSKLTFQVWWALRAEVP